METINLSVNDRDILERLTEEIRRHNELMEMGGAKVEREPRTVLVSCNEAARLLGCTPTTVSTMLRRKELDKLTIKGVSGIPLSSIERLQASR